MGEKNRTSQISEQRIRTNLPSPENFSWHSRFLKFFKKNSLLNSHIVHIETKSFHSEMATRLGSQKITEREIDAFRMKAITLIKNHDVTFPSVAEALKTIKNTPIYATYEHENEAIVILEQRLSPFPGETIILKGSFKRDPKSLVSTIPINFELTKKFSFIHFLKSLCTRFFSLQITAKNTK